MIRFDASDLVRRGNAFVVALERESDKAAHDAAEAGQRRILLGTYWTIRSGKTGRTFYVRALDKNGRWVLGSRNKVALFLQEGTKAHVIRPRAAFNVRRLGERAPRLRFRYGGRTVFPRSVNHPGTSAKKFLEAEEAIGNRDLPRAAVEALGRALSSTGFGK